MSDEKNKIVVGPLKYNLTGSKISVKSSNAQLENKNAPDPYLIHLTNDSIYYSKALIKWPSEDEPPTVDESHKDESIKKPNDIITLQTEFIQSNLNELTTELNEQPESSIRDLSFFLLFVAVVGAFFIMGFWVALALLIIGVILVAIFTHSKQIDKTAVLFYVSNKENVDCYNKLVESGIKLSGFNQKRLIKNDTNIYSNYTPLVFDYRDAKISLFPDRVLSLTSSQNNCYSYEQIKVSKRLLNFTKESYRPENATVMKQSWKYVTKKGEADKRYKDNPPIYECVSDILEFNFDNSNTATFQFPQSSLVQDFVDSFNSYKNAIPEESVAPCPFIDYKKIEDSVDNIAHKPTHDDLSDNKLEFPRQDQKVQSLEQESVYHTASSEIPQVTKPTSESTNQLNNLIIEFQAPTNTELKGTDAPSHPSSIQKSINPIALKIGIALLVILSLTLILYFFVGQRKEGLMSYNDNKGDEYTIFSDSSNEEFYQYVAFNCRGSDCITLECEEKFSTEYDISTCIMEVSSVLAETMELDTSALVQNKDNILKRREEYEASSETQEPEKATDQNYIQQPFNEELLVFANNFISTLNSRNTDKLMGFYNDFVQFHGKNYSIDEIKADKGNYFKRWQHVNFNIDESVEINLKGNIAELTLPVRYLLESPNRNEAISGRATETLIVSKIDNQWKIIAESEKILDQRTYSTQKPNPVQKSNPKKTDVNNVKKETNTDTSKSVNKTSGRDNNADFNRTVSAYIDYLNGLNQSDRNSACQLYSTSSNLNDFEKAAFKKACQIVVAEKTEPFPTQAPRTYPDQPDNQKVDVNQVIGIIGDIIRRVD